MSRWEQQFADLAKKNGYKVIHKGVPDFFCYKPSKSFYVEVKGIDVVLSKDQKKTMRVLSTHHVPTYVWKPGWDFPGKRFGLKCKSKAEIMKQLIIERMDI